MNEWDHVADGWDDDSAARSYAEAAFGSLADLMAEVGASLDGASVLDFGCGTGLLTERLVEAGATVEAVDTSTGMLAVLERKIADHGWTTVRTGTELRSSKGTFDLVVCSSVCAFVDDYPATVAELVARLRGGGRFVQWDWERHDDDSPGFTPGEILTTLEGAGLVDVVVRTAFEVAVEGHTMAPLMGVGLISG